uniref:J domain-containing protein n=1 Tax=Setaria digitata TaxID=48799 RepID=A0A915PMJ4_9BILA
MFIGYRLIAVKRILYSINRYIRQASDYRKNYYDILGVNRNATQQEIKNAFYMLSKKYHPDVTGGAPGSILTERFIMIKEAYDVLKDSESRNEYDAYRAQTSSDHTGQTYNRQYTGYSTRRSNRYGNSSQYHSGWRYDDAHLKRVFEELQRRAEEYERARKEQDELFWEKFYRAEQERCKRRREMPPRPNIKLAIDSWLAGPLLPYLPYLSAVLIIYMIGFFIFSLYSIVKGGPNVTSTSAQSHRIPGVEVDDDSFCATLLEGNLKTTVSYRDCYVPRGRPVLYWGTGCVGDNTMTWRDERFLEALRCPVLVVGVGGIGCEVLKNLALTGFSNIEIIDLDTIDVSNLNRQFLFRREHIGKSKAVTAAEAIRAIAPHVKIVSYHDSVLKEEYGVEFFQKFKVVLSALDNIAARNHINRLCLAARVPLIESGSSGYLGHVRPIIRDYTECYECNPKPVQKTYPGCTIRNTPSEHIHCIVWAKHLFNQLFGEPDDEDEVSPDFTDEENLDGLHANSVEKNGNSSPTVGGKGDSDSYIDGDNGLLNRVSTRKWAAENGYDPKILFRKFFHDDINYLLSMTNLWKQRRKPFPLEWDSLPDENASSSNSEPNRELWTIMQCKIEFEEAVSILRKRLKDDSVLSWDKDDDPAMHFVAACANLRAYIFSIPLKTLFDIKSMAGNIIPAIATTNAIVAGMIVTETLKVVFDSKDTLRNIFIKPKPNPRGKILTDEMPCKPNQQCYVCSERREITLKLNVKMTTVHALENKFLKGILHMVAPDVMISLTGSIVISSEEGETKAISEQLLEKVGVIHGCILECDDFLQKLELRIRIQHTSELKADEFVIAMDTEVTVANGKGDEKQENGKKRPLSDISEECSPSKIRKSAGENSADL